LGVCRNLPMSPSQQAALATILPIGYLVGVWTILLFAAPPGDLTRLEAATDFLEFAFSEQNPDRGFFFLSSLSIVPLALLAVAYLFLSPRSRSFAHVVIGYNLALALFAAVYLSISFAVAVACPVMWSGRGARGRA